MLALALNGLSFAEPGGDQGHKFQLIGGASDSADPENPTNDVMRFENIATPAAATRDLHKGTKIEMLDNQVQIRYYFQSPKTCTFVGGTPRIQLAIDTDGDGDADDNAFGYLGDQPFGGNCPPNTWDIEDMTNAIPKWDITQLGGGFTHTWDSMEAFIQAAFPNHQVVEGALIEDPGGNGVTFYDSLVIGNRDVNTSSDTA
jgi:hypothetical protein